MNKTQSSHWTLTIMVRSQKTWSSKEKFTMIQNLNSEKSWLKNHCRMSIAHSLRFLHKMPPSPPICGSFMRNAPNSQMRNHRRPKMGFSFLFRPALEWMEGSTRVQCLHQAPAWRVHQHQQHHSRRREWLHITRTLNTGPLGQLKVNWIKKKKKATGFFLLIFFLDIYWWYLLH